MAENKQLVVYAAAYETVDAALADLDAIGRHRAVAQGRDDRPDDSQVDDLTAYGCEKIFTDKSSGKHAAR